MENVLQDLRYTLRGLRNAPGFTVVAIATLALGIGVNSTIFSMVNALLLKPLPVERPEELVDIYGHTATASSHDSNSYPNYLDYRDQSETLVDVLAYSNFFANVSIQGSSELVVGEIVTANYFSLLGVRPALGRDYSPAEFTAPGAGPVAILSHPYWQSRFAADPDILGRTLRVNGIVFTVIGVAPAGFGGMFPAVSSQMWIPISMVEEIEPLGNQRNSGPRVGATRLERRAQHWLWIKGRRAEDASLEQARAEVEGIAARLSAEYPESNERERVTVLATSDVAFNPDFDGILRPAGMLMLGVVSLVLLVACANLANMLLARAATRGREIAIRVALGAARGRLVRHLLTESLLLALAGGAAGLLLATWLSGLIARFQPPLPIAIDLALAPDWRVFLFTMTAAAITGIVFGLAPAVRASRPDLVPALKDTGEGSGRSRRLELRDALVVIQVAVSLVLLVAGALMIRSLALAQRVDMGYDMDRTAFLGLAMEMNGYDRAQSGLFFAEGSRRLAALAEVEAVGLTSRVPQSLNNNGFGVYIDGHQAAPTDRPYIMDGAYIDEGYVGALGLGILEGRGIEAADRDEDRRVAVVTQEMVTRYWPGQSALGREFRTSWEGEPWRIVGIVENHKVDTPGEAPKPYLYLPLGSQPVFGNYMVRTTGPAATTLPLLERELRAIDPDIVFLETSTVRQLADVRLFPIRAGAWLIGVFGLLALTLAAVGLYGVIGYSVSRRVREIGIRKALGAETGRVLELVMRQGLVLVVIGGVVGAVLAEILALLLSSVLFVGSFDVVSFAVAFAVLFGVAALANWIPARRAARVDPMIALRGD